MCLWSTIHTRKQLHIQQQHIRKNWTSKARDANDTIRFLAQTTVCNVAFGRENSFCRESKCIKSMFVLKCSWKWQSNTYLFQKAATTNQKMSKKRTREKRRNDTTTKNIYCSSRSTLATPATITTKASKLYYRILWIWW